MASTERERMIERLNELVLEATTIPVRNYPGQRTPIRNAFSGTEFAGPTRYASISPGTEIDRAALQSWVIACELAFADLDGGAPSAVAAWRGLGDCGAWGPERLSRARAIVERLLIEPHAGRVIEPLSARVRARTEQELIDQARDACDEGPAWVVVAAVLAGAALEMRLHRIAVGRVTVPPKTTLGGLIVLLQKARDAGTPTVDAADDRLLVHWRDIRNDAAHRTAAFPWKPDALRAELVPLEAFLRRAPVEHRSE